MSPRGFVKLYGDIAKWYYELALDLKHLSLFWRKLLMVFVMLQVVAVFPLSGKLLVYYPSFWYFGSFQMGLPVPGSFCQPLYPPPPPAPTPKKKGQVHLLLLLIWWCGRPDCQKYPIGWLHAVRRSALGNVIFGAFRGLTESGGARQLRKESEIVTRDET